MKVACEHCDAGLAIDPTKGWFSWHVRADVVEAVHVTCCNGKCNAAVAKFYSSSEWRTFDHHLDRFTGILSTKRLAELVNDYTWSRAALRKMTDLFVAFSVLPTTRESVFLSDAESGGLPLLPFFDADRRRVAP